MKVKELIEALTDLCEPDADVVIVYNDVEYGTLFKVLGGAGLMTLKYCEGNYSDTDSYRYGIMLKSIETLVCTVS